MNFEISDKNVQTYRHTEFILFQLEKIHHILFVYVYTLFLKKNKISSSCKTFCNNFVQNIVSIINQTSQNRHEIDVKPSNEVKK